MIRERKPLPEVLGAYTIDSLRRVKFKRRRGRDGNEQKVRRRLIWEAVERGKSRGLHRSPSATSAVAEAYHMTADAVYKIYKEERVATLESWNK